MFPSWIKIIFIFVVADILYQMFMLPLLVIVRMFYIEMYLGYILLLLLLFLDKHTVFLKNADLLNERNNGESLL